MKSIISIAHTPAPTPLPHIHPEWELGICYGGNCSIVSGENVYDLSEGDIYLCPPDVEHYMFIEEIEGLTGCVIKFCDFDILKLDHIYTVLKSDGDTVASLISIALKLSEGEGVANAMAVSYLLDAIVRLIVKDDEPRVCSSTVMMLRERIESRYFDTEFKIPTAITELGYNADYLRRLFKQEMGISPSDYLTEIRVERAKALLAEPKGLAITQIAYACGFYDANYFTRLFGQKVGMTPSEYKRKTREDRE